MKPFTVGALCVSLSLASAAIGAMATIELVLGDGTVPRLRVWDFEDLSGTPALKVTKTVRGQDVNAVALYELIPDGEAGPASPFGSAIRLEGSGSAVGGYFYSENEGSGAAYGLNVLAATYNGKPAVGLEVNGVNRSGVPDARVRGIDIVNGGDAPTQWALGVQTSNLEPVGKPEYGIVLGGPDYGYRHNPARETGLVIDRIDSGEAIEIQPDHYISLSGRQGDVRMLYNSQTEQIEFYRGEELRFAIPM